MSSVAHGWQLKFTRVNMSEPIIHVELLNNSGAREACAVAPIDWLEETITDGQACMSVLSDWKCEHGSEAFWTRVVSDAGDRLATTRIGSDGNGNAASGATGAGSDDTP